MISLSNIDFSKARKETTERIGKRLNFYRVHLLFFTFTPLVFSIIFYLSNGRYKISYIDSLFNCVSAMTVCGLATINLSSLTGFQQALLFIQMSLGNPIIISWVMVLIRKYFFAKKFEHIIKAAAAEKAAKMVSHATEQRRPWPSRIAAVFSGKSLSVIDEENGDSDSKNKLGGVMRKLRPDMIRRMDTEPKLINPSGWVSEGRPAPVHTMPFVNPRLDIKTSHEDPNPKNPPRANPMRRSASVDFQDSKRRRLLSDPGHPSRPSSPVIATRMHRFETVAETAPSPTGSPKRFPRTQTVEFAPAPRRPERVGHHAIPENGTLYEEPEHSPEMRSIRSRRASTTAPTVASHSQYNAPRTDSIYRGYGGFPMPWAIFKSLFERLFPGAKQKLVRTMTIPATMSISPSRVAGDPNTKQVPYISFDAIVGRNSAFHLLTSDQMEELGGVEYRALNALLWVVSGYHILIQLIAFIILAPYISRARWNDVFKDEQIRPLNSNWFSAFQVVSSYTNSGMSLVDQSMVPFQNAKLMIIIMVILILAGNTSFPIFLRFVIWCLSKAAKKGSRLNETLHFLLDHPRRCFIYLFPSHQTWFLFTIVLGLTFIDWFFFLLLDIGNDSLEQIPLNIRVLDGFMQAIAVRAAGFGIVPLAAIAPAVKVLYVVMMYISVYPIAMSVRSTNVYEEQSLGVFQYDHLDDEEQTFEPSGSRMTVWSRYLTMHARRQLAFDMWWLALFLFVICIIERSNLDNPDYFGWFNIFNIIFELVSAYGTVGLSLGIPNQNYSFSGAMHPSSKFIICLVMLRGRHRGLPNAIDRAIMLPSQLEKAEENMLDARSQFSGNAGEGNTQPFRYSETMNSHHGSEMRQRARHASGRFDDDNLQPLPENGESHHSNEGEDIELGQTKQS